MDRNWAMMNLDTRTSLKYEQAPNNRSKFTSTCPQKKQGC